MKKETKRGLTVHGLIELLKHLPQEAEVCIEDVSGFPSVTHDIVAIAVHVRTGDHGEQIVTLESSGEILRAPRKK
jgi:hypothetical protein